MWTSNSINGKNVSNAVPELTGYKYVKDKRKFCKEEDDPDYVNLDELKKYLIEIAESPLPKLLFPKDNEKRQEILKEEKAKVQTSIVIAPDDFIRNLKVVYNNNSSVILAPQGKKSKDYSCQEMGFKETAKTWTMFIDVLQMDDPQYHVGTYSKDKNPVKNRGYYSSYNKLKEFSKKFIAFLNKTYSAQIPSDLNVFENRKGIERDGTYRPIFKVVSSDIKKDTNIKITTKEQLFKELETLSTKYKREKNPKEKERLFLQLGFLIETGKKKSLITITEASCYLKNNDAEDENPSHQQMLLLIQQMITRYTCSHQNGLNA